MNVIFSILLVFFIVLLLAILATWLDGKEKVQFIGTVIDKVSSLIDSKMESVTNQREAGPWYIVVYTKDSGYPIWISHNNIRSLHPDPNNYRLIIKTFDREDMVIGNVSSYEMCAANDMIGCCMKKDIQHYLTE